MALSKEKQEKYNAIVTEYDTFMNDHGKSVEAGDMKLLQEMMRLEANKAVFEALNDTETKTENVYGKTLDDSSTDTRSKIQLGPNSGLNPGLVAPKIDTPPQAVVNALKSQQPIVEQKKETKSPSIEIDPKTGKKVYKGPRLRSRTIIKGEEHDHNLPLPGEEENE